MKLLLLMVAFICGLILMDVAIAKVSTHYRWYNMVKNCEARGVNDPWYANTGNGFYFGPQFTASTWHSSGGGPVKEMGDKTQLTMHSYSVRYIIRIAENTMKSQGYDAWPICHTYLY